MAEMKDMIGTTDNANEAADSTKQSRIMDVEGMFDEMPSQFQNVL